MRKKLGVVSSYSTSTEYGFVKLLDEAGKAIEDTDVFFHINDVEVSVQRLISKGTCLLFNITETGKGARALEITSPLSHT